MRDIPPLSQSLLVLTVLVYAVVWFSGLGYRDLIDPDEGRYAEIPREMVATGDWLTPRLHDMRYFHKPPLQYWMQAAAFSLFGVSDGVARLPLAILGFLGAVWLAFVACKLFGKAAALPAFVLSLSGVLYCGIAHFITVDMTLTFFLMVGIGALLLAQSAPSDDARQTRNWMLLGWSALAFAMMTKGLIAIVLPAGAVAVYSLWKRDVRWWRQLHIGKGLVLFLVLASPWFVWMTTKHEYFFHFFFVKEHFLRYTTDVHVHEEPLYYFIPILLIGALPFTSSALLALLKPAFAWNGGAAKSFEPERFLWCFAVFSLVFFSMGNSKLPPYIAPAIAALVLLVSARIARTGRLGIDPWLLIIAGACIALLGTLANRFANDAVPVALFQAVQPWMIASGVAMLAGGLLLQHQHKNILQTLPVAGLFVLLSIQCLLWGFQGMSPVRSGREMADALRVAGITQDTPIYEIGTHLPSLPFYLGRVVTIGTYQNELEGSREMDGHKMVDTPRAFLVEWRALNKGAAIFLNEDYESYNERFDFDQDSEIILRGPKWTLVKRPNPANLGSE